MVTVAVNVTGSPYTDVWSCAPSSTVVVAAFLTVSFSGRDLLPAKLELPLYTAMMESATPVPA